jgi:hypothetical protein
MNSKNRFESIPTSPFKAPLTLQPSVDASGALMTKPNPPNSLTPPAVAFSASISPPVVSAPPSVLLKYKLNFSIKVK